ncbi:MAG: hypothetical protein ACWGQW_00165 [bacterium]
MKSPIIFDADGIVLTSVSSATRTVEWDKFLESLYADLSAAKVILHNQVGRIQEQLGKDRPVHMCFSSEDRHYFRHDIYPEYKGNRVSKGLPMVGLKTLREWAQLEWPSTQMKGLEADDVCGILATKFMRDYGLSPTVVSVDKDMLQIGGIDLLDPSKPGDATRFVDPKEAEKFLWTQVLTGDTVDGYPGCKGVGEVNAARILNGTLPHEQAAYAAYLKAGHTEEFFNQMVNVARILTIDTYDLNKQEPIPYVYHNPY